MALADLTAPERHRRIAGDFTERVQRVPDWGVPAPVAGWTARDVVEHLVTWLPSFLSAGGVALPTGPAVADDPVAAWTYHADTVQALLDDPERAATQYSYERVGSMPVAEAIDRFYTSDVFMHTWDLARASGQDVTLEPAFCTELLAGMEPMEEAMRSSGQYGPKVDVPPDADPQTRMIGFIGREPCWRPDTLSSRNGWRLRGPVTLRLRRELAMTRTDTASRTVTTPPDSVYAALIDPAAMLQWLPPTGMTARFEHFDARPGGGYRMVLTYADVSGSPGKATADSDVVDVRFIELVPDVRVVQAVDFDSDDPRFAGTMTMTWELVATDDGTRVEIRADDVPHGISAKDHAAGLASSLANLAAYLKQ